MRFCNRSRTKTVYAMSLFMTSFLSLGENAGLAQQLFTVTTTVLARSSS
jgi:hypothetical protein